MIRNKSVSVFLCHCFKLQYYAWKKVCKWCLSRTFCFSSMRIQALKWEHEERKLVKEVFASMIYKHKADKVKSLDLREKTSEKPEGNPDWWDTLWKKRMSHLEWIETDSPHHYNTYTTSQFLQLTRESRLKPEHINRLNISEDLTSEEKKLLIKILYQKKECLAWDFSEIKRIDSEVMPSQKINTVFHKAW